MARGALEARLDALIHVKYAAWSMGRDNCELLKQLADGWATEVMVMVGEIQKKGIAPPVNPVGSD